MTQSQQNTATFPWEKERGGALTLYVLKDPLEPAEHGYVSVVTEVGWGPHPISVEVPPEPAERGYASVVIEEG